MVRFGSALEDHAEAYSGIIDQDRYLDYEKLKGILYDTPDRFLVQFEEEVGKMEHFLRKKDELFEPCLTEGCPCKLPGKEARIKFLKMNREGARKILKKFDKETLSHTQAEFLAKVDALYTAHLSHEELTLVGVPTAPLPQIEGSTLPGDAPPRPASECSQPSTSSPTMVDAQQDRRRVRFCPSPVMTDGSAEAPVAQSAPPPQGPAPSDCPEGDDVEYIKWTTICGLQVGFLHRQVKAQTVKGVCRISVGDKVIHTAESFLVYDPQNKGRYLIPPILIEDTMGKTDYMAKKQAFICMLYQKGADQGHKGCNAYHSCNQLHVSRQAVAALRDMTSQGAGYTVKAGNNFVVELRDVVDPGTNATYVLPYHRTEATLGRATYAKTRDSAGGAPKKPPVLCLYYLEGRCRHGKQCRGIHADPPYIAKLRFGNACCPKHHPDRAATPPANISVKVRWGSTSDGVILDVPHELVTATTGLMSLPLRQSKTGLYLCFASGKLCRLHRENRCEYGDQCNNIHVCLSYKPDEQAQGAQATKAGRQGAPAAAAEAAASTAPPSAVATPVNTPMQPRQPEQPAGDAVARLASAFQTQMNTTAFPFTLGGGSGISSLPMNQMGFAGAQQGVPAGMVQGGQALPLQGMQVPMQMAPLQGMQGVHGVPAFSMHPGMGRAEGGNASAQQILQAMSQQQHHQQGAAPVQEAGAAPAGVVPSSLPPAEAVPEAFQHLRSMQMQMGQGAPQQAFHMQGQVYGGPSQQLQGSGF